MTVSGHDAGPAGAAGLRFSRFPWVVGGCSVRLVAGLSAATRNCSETATKLPGGGHENCPLTVTGSARHDVVCLTGSHG